MCFTQPPPRAVSRRPLAPKSSPLRRRGRRRAHRAPRHHVGLAAPPATAPGETPRAHEPNSELSPAVLAPCSPLKAFPVLNGPDARGCWALHLSALLRGGRPWGPRGGPAPAGWPMGMWAEARAALAQWEGHSRRWLIPSWAAGSGVALGCPPFSEPGSSSVKWGQGCHHPQVGCSETKQVDGPCSGAVWPPQLPGAPSEAGVGLSYQLWQPGLLSQAWPRGHWPRFAAKGPLMADERALPRLSHREGGGGVR